MTGPLERADGDQYRLLADNAPVMVWRADTTKACDFVNKPWLEFTGVRETGHGSTPGGCPVPGGGELAGRTRVLQVRPRNGIA